MRPELCVPSGNFEYALFKRDPHSRSHVSSPFGYNWAMARLFPTIMIKGSFWRLPGEVIRLVVWPAQGALGLLASLLLTETIVKHLRKLPTQIRNVFAHTDALDYGHTAGALCHERARIEQAAIPPLPPSQSYWVPGLPHGAPKYAPTPSPA
eukprot:gene10334-8270_t